MYPAWPENVDQIERWVKEVVEPLSKELPNLERGLAEFQNRLTELDDTESFLNGVLQTQTEELRAFLGPAFARAEVALTWAELVREVTTVAHADMWEEARLAILEADGIAASKLYAAVPIDLQPQMGLVPIGMNPVTELWEFYHLRSAWDPASEMQPTEIPIPGHDDYGSITVTEETGIVFVLIPGGRFEPLEFPHAKPPPPGDLEPYFLARHELTQGQWGRLSERPNPSWIKAGTRKVSGPLATLAHPVENPSFTECEQLLVEQGLVVPTQAQWEYACRAGTTTRWFTGDLPESLLGYANVLDKAAWENRLSWGPGESFDDGHNGTAPVGSFLPNKFGLYDMHGNVEEFCRDHADLRIALRGGSFHHKAYRAASAYTFRNKAELFDFFIGVRAARAIQR